MKMRYSMASDYLRCPTLYHYKHIEGLAEPGLKSTAMAFGTGIHLGIELIFTADLNTALAVFESYWKAIDFSEYEEDRLTPDQLAVNAVILLSRFETRHKKHFEPLFLEHKLSGIINGVEFEGTVDFVGRYRGKLCIIDWKTSAYRFPKERIIVNEQMPLYAELLKQQEGLEAEQVGYITFIKHVNEPSISSQVRNLTTASKEALRQNVHTIAKASTGPVYKNTNSCIMGTRVCAFFNKCWETPKK